MDGSLCCLQVNPYLPHTSQDDVGKYGSKFQQKKRLSLCVCMHLGSNTQAGIIDKVWTSTV